MKALFLAVTLLTSALTLPAFAAGRTVEIKAYMFMTVNVHTGDTVTWVNRDEVPHTVVERNRLFHSAALDTGDTYSYTFTKAGTYQYFCSLHPQLVAQVIVSDAPPPAKAPAHASRPK